MTLCRPQAQVRRPRACASMLAEEVPVATRIAGGHKPARKSKSRRAEGA
jgi:hypothetical protein